MKVSAAIGCILLAFVVGGCAGFLLRMHTITDRANKAIANRYLEERQYLAVLRRSLLLEIERHHDTAKWHTPARRWGKRKEK